MDSLPDELILYIMRSGLSASDMRALSFMNSFYNNITKDWSLQYIRYTTFFKTLSYTELQLLSLFHHPTFPDLAALYPRTDVARMFATMQKNNFIRLSTRTSRVSGCQIRMFEPTSTYDMRTALGNIGLPYASIDAPDAFAYFVEYADTQLRVPPACLFKYYSGLVRVAARSSDFSFVRALVAHEPAPDSAPWVASLMHYAAERRDGAFLAVLLAGGVDPNTRNAAGTTPLFYFRSADDTRTIHALVDAGAELNATNNVGDTPLTNLARLGGDLDAALTLLSIGAEATSPAGHVVDIARANGHIDLANTIAAHIQPPDDAPPLTLFTQYTPT